MPEDGAWPEPWPEDARGGRRRAPTRGEGADGPIRRRAGLRAPGPAPPRRSLPPPPGERNIRFDPTKERGAVYYDQAARHTRRVRLLKIALPTVAVLSVAGFFAVMSWDAEVRRPAGAEPLGHQHRDRARSPWTSRTSPASTAPSAPTRSTPSTRRRQLGSPKVVTLADHPRPLRPRRRRPRQSRVRRPGSMTTTPRSSTSPAASPDHHQRLHRQARRRRRRCRQGHRQLQHRRRDQRQGRRDHGRQHRGARPRQARLLPGQREGPLPPARGSRDDKPAEPRHRASRPSRRRRRPPAPAEAVTAAPDGST